MIIKDSQYALLFSNSDIVSNETITPQIPEPTKAFLLYACLNVAPFAVKLKTLQDFNRSETSVLSIDPELVSTLRRTYLRMRGWPGLSGSSDVNRSELLSNKRDDEDFGKYFGAAHGSISKEITTIRNDGGDFSLTEGCKPLIREVNKQAIHVDYPFQLDYSHYFFRPNYNDRDTYGFFAYFALVVSLAEVGVGARESAVHLLQREITFERRALGDRRGPYQKQQVKPDCSGSTPNVNCQVSRNKIDYEQRLVVLLRLEATQFDIMRGLPSNALIGYESVDWCK